MCYFFKQHALFTSVYGIPHHGEEKLKFNSREFEESDILQKMKGIQENLKKVLNTAKTNGDITYVFGDLQDTPDNSKNFRYGPSRISTHPLGIVKTCEDCSLSCNSKSP